jgi:hypothetical protein
MTSYLSIVEKTSSLSDETICIMFGCVVHFHGYRNLSFGFVTKAKACEGAGQK